MAERYNPVVRERQWQHIRELMQQDRETLFRQMDRDIGIVTRGQAWTLDAIHWLLQNLRRNRYPKLNLGDYSWRFYLYMRHVQPKVCKEWKFCVKVRDPRNADRVELATHLADFLVDKGMYRAGFDTAAVALLMIDPEELCGCDE